MLEGDRTTITVPGGRPYPVEIGTGLVDRLPVLIGADTGVRQVLVVHTTSVDGLADRVCAELSAADLLVRRVTVPDAEAAKTAHCAAELWKTLGVNDFTRTDGIVGIGGGAVTDLAGFVAATWLRGVRMVAVPTTLLAMVDAAVGGKTGINTDEGKNLVGAFHPPAGVLCDLASLASLPPGELVSGMAEIVKCGFIADPMILRLVDTHGVLDPSSPVLRELVERSIQVKADVVGQDLTESWLREILNYGHTLGHAIELQERYRWRHGEAISVGMVFAAELSRLDGRLSAADVDLHRRLLAGLGLPIQYRSDRFEELLAAMRRDKKARGATIRFVVLDAIGRPARLDGPPVDQLRAAYAAVS